MALYQAFQKLSQDKCQGWSH